MVTPMTVRGRPVSGRALRLASKDRADHPDATDRTCRMVTPHDPHPWGRLAASRRSLAHYCPGLPATGRPRQT